MNKKILGLALAASFATGSAQALTINDTFLNAYETTEIAQTGSLSQFDGTLGTLNSVTLRVLGDSISSTVLTNNAAGAESFSFDSVLNFFFDLSSVGLTPPAPAFTTTLATTGGFVNLGSGQTLDLGTTTDDGFFEFLITGVGVNAFIGNGDFNVGCNTLSGSTFIGGGGNIDNAQNTTARCGANISYDYDTNQQVPEPTTLALMGLGLAAFGFGRRKAK